MPLFPGDSELQQLLHIFKLLGTPSEAEWAGVSKLRDWHEFPNWRKQDLHKHFPTLGAEGIDLMERMFAYTPSQRISVRRVPSRSLHAPLAYGTWLACIARDARSMPGPPIDLLQLLIAERMGVHLHACLCIDICVCISQRSSVSYLVTLEVLRLQARDALQHPYFDDLDKEEVDKLENPVVRAREG